MSNGGKQRIKWKNRAEDNERNVIQEKRQEHIKENSKYIKSNTDERQVEENKLLVKKLVKVGSIR